MARILVVDDELNICWALEAYLTGEGHAVTVAGTAADAMASLEAGPPDLLISDIRLPGTDGVELLKRVRALSSDVPVILMTAYGDVDTGVAAMQNGAFEYLHKPIDLDQIGVTVQRALLRRQAAVDARPAVSADAALVPRLVGRSVAMQEVYKLIGLVSAGDVPVLVEGESGVGKELVARAIHEHSRRHARPFVAVNCGSLPEALLESELFGYERGAFTGAAASKPGRWERADGGTLFLDEVAELSPANQAALLRVIEDGRVERLGGTRSIDVDVRIIAATNRSLRDEVAARRFRDDLYFRLQVVTIHVPALRERTADLPDLVAHFLGLAARQSGREPQRVAGAAMDVLSRYAWPGNIRELENAIRRAAVLARDSVIALADLPEDISGAEVRTAAAARPSVAEVAEAEFRARLEDGVPAGSIYHDLIDTVEAALIHAALEATGGNQVRAAELLGVHRATLRKRMPPVDEPS
jgi:two-component system nitrogen regulation response regulator GlnG